MIDCEQGMQRHKFWFYSGSIFEVTDWRRLCFDFIVFFFGGGQLEEAVCYDFIVGLFWTNKWMILFFCFNFIGFLWCCLIVFDSLQMFLILLTRCWLVGSNKSLQVDQEVLVSKASNANHIKSWPTIYKIKMPTLFVVWRMVFMLSAYPFLFPIYIYNHIYTCKYLMVVPKYCLKWKF